MEAVILGSSPGLPQADRNLSSIYIEHNGVKLLADCGDGCSRRLLERGIKADDLDAVFITHYHPDHVGGLFILLQMLYLMGRRKTLYVFLPERPAAFMEILQLMYTFTERFSFRLQILDMQQCELMYDWISVMPNDHLFGYAELIREHQLTNPMNCWSLRFCSPQGDLVYTSDITTTDSIAELISNAHTVIVDAGHPEAEQILKLKYLGLQRVILTHGRSQSLLDRQDELDSSLFIDATEDYVYTI